MKTEEDDQVVASRIEKREALREKAHEAATPRLLCARKAEEEGAEEDKEPPAEAKEEDAREKISRRKKCYFHLKINIIILTRIHI